MSVPKDLVYTEDHEWVFVEEDQATIGVTDFAQKELGDVVFVELPEIGDTLEQFEEFGVIESVKAVSDIFSPVSGEVISINEDLLDQPELINNDPFGEGWIVKVEINNPEEIEKLMDYQEYEQFLEEE